MTLRRIGYWKESLDDAYPLAEEVVGALPAHQRDAVAKYLEAGRFSIWVFMGHSTCRLGCPGANGCREQTDGKWIWPSGLVHYVRVHGVAMPEEFVEDACRAAPVACQPSLEDVSDMNLWIEWARQRRRPEVEAFMRSANDELLRASAAARDAEVASLVERFGLGDRPCATEGCGRRVLSGSLFCGHCVFDRSAHVHRAAANPMALRTLQDKVRRLIETRG
jgi:hypothetical protein